MLNGAMRRCALAFVLALSIAVPCAFAASDQGAPRKAEYASKLYIVQMTDAPVVSYTGGVPGLSATKPAQGQKIDPRNADVVRYATYLISKHDDALRRVGGARKAYSYTYSFHGFAAELSEAQVAALKASSDVVAVSKDTVRPLDTISTPAFL